MANLGVAAVVKMAAFVLLCVLVTSPGAAHAQIECKEVVNALVPCVRYVQNGQGEPPQCCQNVQDLINRCKTRADRQSICYCVKPYAPRFSESQIQNANRLPGHCGVSIPYTIQRDMDCSSIN